MAKFPINAGWTAAFSAFALSVLAMTATAQAATAELRYDDLDLASEAGKAELARRIEVVARKACPLSVVTGSRISRRAAQQQCISDAKKQVETQMAARNAGGRYGG